MTRAVPNRQIAEEATEWAVRLDCAELSANERKALANWLRASPAHVDELLYSASILAGLEGVDRERKHSIDAYLAEAAPDVIPLFGEQRPRDAAVAAARWVRGRTARTHEAIERWGGLAVAASLAVVTLVGLTTSAGPGDSPVQHQQAAAFTSRTYTTDLGEQRSITLADGSVVFLNTSSRARVWLSPSERRIDLLQGEALFEVAHEPSRPFRVFAAGTMAEAVGTKFNVRRTPDGVQLVVVEGKVLVDNDVGRPGRGTTRAPSDADSLAPDQALVAAGQQADLRSNLSAPLIRKADIVTAASWRMRQLSFDDVGLDEIVAEFNRYNRTPIVVAEPSLARTHLSGVFDANDPDSFIAFLELSTSVEVDRSQSGRIVLRPK